MIRPELRGTRLSDDDQAALRRRLLETARAVPRVTHAAWVSSVPTQGTTVQALFVPGLGAVDRLGRFTVQTAGPDYFATMGTRVLRGRPITEADRAGTPRVAVVSADMARALWPGQEALGRCLRVGADTAPCATVVGIAETAVHAPTDAQPLRYYLPIDQFPETGGDILLLRVRGEPAAMAADVQRALQAAMPGQSYVSVQALRELLNAQRRSWHLGATTFGVFGGLALVVAGVGLYAVIAHAVTQRSHELSVRIALGASTGDVVQLVLRQGMRSAAAGLALGTALALVLSPRVEPVLYQQSATDPLVYGGVAATLLLVALAACAAPAIRAARTAPNAVLRAE